MNTNQPASQWMHLKERLVTTLVGLIPRIPLGAKLRNLLYRTILKRLGSSVFIQVGAEFIGTSGIEIGDGVHIYRDVRLYNEGSNSKICIRDRVYLDRGVTIGSGENCCIEICEDAHISAYTCIYGPGQVKIGKDCAIGEHSGICANNRNFADVTRKIRDQGLTCKGIVIEDDCWLGHAVTVLDGVTIGQGSVIGAGAVVTKDIPPYSVAVGVPARVIRSRMPSKIESECLPIDKPLPLV